MATALANGANDATGPSLWILFRLFCPCRLLRLPERCPGGSRCTLSSCGFPARPLIYPCFSHAKATPQRGLPGGESVIPSSAKACLRDLARGVAGAKKIRFFSSRNADRWRGGRRFFIVWRSAGLASLSEDKKMPRPDGRGMPAARMAAGRVFTCSTLVWAVAQ